MTLKTFWDKFFLISYFENKKILRFCLALGILIVIYMVGSEASSLLDINTWIDFWPGIIGGIILFLFMPLLVCYLPIFLFVLPTRYIEHIGFKRLCLSSSVFLMLVVSYVSYQDLTPYDSFEKYIEYSWWKIIISAYIPSILYFNGFWIYDGFKK